MIVATPSGKKPIAYRLTGAQLDGGWVVGDLINQWSSDKSGGLASAQYIVDNESERAFLKALDFTDSHRHRNPEEAIASAMAAFAFEVDAMEFFLGKSRIVTIITHGRYFPIKGEEAFFVPYLIFELADCDIREYLSEQAPDAAWCLRAAHQLTVAVSQLHNGGYLHQDIRASNALLFKLFGIKLGDLGSACMNASDHNKSGCVGTWNYQPPERWYGVAIDDSVRRAGDLFLLGGLIVYMFTQVPMRALLLERHLAPAHRPGPKGKWTGTYEMVLPHLQHSFALALDEVYNHLPVMADRSYDYRPELVELLRNLCDPDYRKRGFVASDGGRTLDLQRAVTRFALLAQRIESRGPSRMT